MFEVVDTVQEDPKKKFERKIRVTYIDKSLPPEVFNDVDDANYGDIWVRIRLKNKRLAIISTSQIHRMDTEWSTKEI